MQSVYTLYYIQKYTMVNIIIYEPFIVLRQFDFNLTFKNI